MELKSVEQRFTLLENNHLHRNAIRTRPMNSSPRKTNEQPHHPASSNEQPHHPASSIEHMRTSSNMKKILP